jgi:putative ABC transport system permease protein
MGTAWHDLRYGLRVLRARPAFTAVAVAALALGIGANTAIFSMVSAVLLRPLPWKDPDRIVTVWETNPKRNQTRTLVSTGNFLDWKDRQRSFSQTAAWRFLYFNLTGRDQPERVQGLIVSADFFSLLGVKAAMGRTFTEEEDQPGRNKIVVMSHGLWKRRYGGDPSLIGQKITVEGEPYTVIGILPADFQMIRVLNRELDLFQPLALDPTEVDRADHAIFVYGRLKPGVPLAQAQVEMETIYRRLEQENPVSNSGWSASLISLPDSWVAKSRPVLLMLLLAAGGVLLISCANVANLLLARATSRRKEMALRAALGAGRVRLVRQLLTESLLLSLLGGGMGLLLSFWATDFLNDLVPYTAVNRMNRFYLDTRVLLFTLFASISTGLIFGLAPALRSSKLNLNESLSEGRNATETKGGKRLRALLVACEVALAVVLLIGAGLMIETSLRLQRDKRGFDAHNVLTMQLWLPNARYPDSQRIASFYREVLERVRTLPGVESVAAANFPPLALQYTTIPFTIEGQTPAKPEEAPVALYSVISPDYFHTMAIPLLRGRGFGEQDGEQQQGVVVISENMAQRFWPGQDPIGRQLKPYFPKLKAFWLPRSNESPLTVVGVVGDVKRDWLSDGNLPQMYLPYRQNASSIMNLLVRTGPDPENWASAVSHEVRAVDKDQAVFDVKSMEDVLAESFSQPRIFGSLLAAFALLALCLAATGIYGVVSFTVAQRTHEIGVRIALGARSSDILRLIMWQGMSPVGAGLTIGVAGAFALNRALSSFLYGVSPTDPSTFAVVAILLAAVAMLGCYVPARRATKMDPVTALRYE